MEVPNRDIKSVPSYLKLHVCIAHILCNVYNLVLHSMLWDHPTSQQAVFLIWCYFWSSFHLETLDLLINNQMDAKFEAGVAVLLCETVGPK